MAWNIDGEEYTSNAFESDEIDIAEWEQAGEYDGMKGSQRKQKEIELKSVAHLLESSKALSSVKKSKKLPSTQRYAVEVNDHAVPAKAFVQMSDKTIRIPKELKHKENTAKSKIRDAVTVSFIILEICHCCR